MAHFKGPVDFMLYCHCLQSEEKVSRDQKSIVTGGFSFLTDASLRGSSVTPEKKDFFDKDFKVLTNAISII